MKKNYYDKPLHTPFMNNEMRANIIFCLAVLQTIFLIAIAFKK